tara:strand:- start:6402 stop:8729 length:2328 start_codon:yes stop_codon:yes gene_type:complete
MKQIIYLFLIPFFLIGQSPLSDRYNTYDEINLQLSEWNLEFGNNENPSPYYSGSGIIYHLIELGTSTHDNLPFWGVRLSYNADEKEDEPRVLILGQCHAEEIYGIEISMELIDMFLHPMDYPAYSQNMKYILQLSEVWIIPTYNPEGLKVVHGYESANGWIQDVSFRKNKRDTNLNNAFDFIAGVGSDSDGVDLNRNYDFNWIFGDDLWTEDNSGGTYQAHFDYYKGESPFSESETQAIEDLAYEQNFLLSIAYHSSRSGNVSEMVIFPWFWEDIKFSPDWEIIFTLGSDIANLIPNEVGDGFYLPVWSGGLKGNAHDWFYSQTGCIQYLIEVGSSNMQPDSVDLIEETISKNLRGTFHLMNKAIGYPIGDLGAEVYQVTGTITDAALGEPIESIVTIDELNGPMLENRTTDEFGRYRRLLKSGTFTLTASARGYEPQTQNVTPGSGLITERDIALESLPEYNLTLNVQPPPSFQGLIQLSISDPYGLVAGETVESTYSIELPSNEYRIQLTGNDLTPEFFNVNLTSDFNQSITMVEQELIFNEPFDNLSNWTGSTGSWNISAGVLSSQETVFYSQDTISVLSSTINNPGNQNFVLSINLKYELEWENDIAFLSILGSSDTSTIYWDDQHWEFHDEYVLIPSPGDSFKIEIGIIPDNSIQFRGLKIDQISIMNQGTQSIGGNGDLLLPQFYSFSTPFPNPFNTTAIIEFSVPEITNVEITVFDILGRKVERLFDEEIIQGTHKLNWNPVDISSGLYFIRLTSDNFSKTHKLLLLK